MTNAFVHTQIKPNKIKLLNQLQLGLVREEHGKDEDAAPTTAAVRGGRLFSLTPMGEFIHG